MKIVAVLTGDVNASSQLGQQQARQLERLLRSCYQDLATAMPNYGIDHFTCFRGDSWQFVVGDPTKAVDAALYFRASLLIRSYEEFSKRLYSSVAIGFGHVDFFPNKKSAAGGGEAYELSGRRLDKLRRRTPGMGVAGLDNIGVELDVVLGVVDALTRRWTASQAQAVCLALKGRIQEEIAQKWNPKPISQQAVQKHLSAAGWPAIDPLLKWIYTTVSGCI